jgi:hypothetical protein
MNQAISKQISESKAKAVLRFRRNQAMRYNSTMEPLPQTDEILDRLAAGESLRAICGPVLEAAVRRRVIADEPAGFASQYARARSIGIDALAESTLAIASDKTQDPNSRRVQVDTIKWFASKLRPDKYGDRTVISGDQNAPISVTVAYEDRPAKLGIVVSPKLLPAPKDEE